MHFRLLGPVEIESADAVLVVPRRRERCLLGILLVELDRIVPVDRLAELLWDGDPPDHARRTIHTHVSRLRSMLATSRAAEAGVKLESWRTGYRMRADPESVDVHRFRGLLDEASRIQHQAERVERLRGALALWRGPVLENAASDWLRDRLCAELEERRVAAIEDVMAGNLALGREREILPELAHLTRLYPVRERLVEVYLRALYRDGRKAEALDAYARTRTFLADELGVDPGPQLQDLHQRILRDEVLPPSGEEGPFRARSSTPPVPRQLPADIASFTGRTGYLHQLDSLLPGDDAQVPVIITAIGGTAGIGKTALAVHWAHRVADRFPDGQLYLNLRGFDPNDAPVEPIAAVRLMLDALQVPPPQIPASLDAIAGLYRSLLADRKMLILLDNARDADQVRPLLPGAPGCLVVVTSRNQLSALVAAEGAHSLTLDLPTTTEARDLLESRLGAARITAEPDAIDEIIARCARLPLALAVVAARAAAQPRFPLQVLANELGRSRSALDSLSDRQTADLRAVFSWSCRALSEGASTLFRILGLHPGPDVAVPAVAALSGLPEQDVLRLLSELTQGHLVNEHVPGRYTLHDLLGSYAAELADRHDTDDERRVALHRLLDHYLHTAHAAAMLLNPHRYPITPVVPLGQIRPVALDDHAAALSWFRTEHAALAAAVSHAVRTGFDVHAWQLAWCLVDYFRRQGYWHEWVDTQTAALAAGERLADPLAQAVSHRALASAYGHLRLDDEARPHLFHALDRFRELRDRAGQAHTHIDIGVALEQAGRHQDALEHAQRALDLYRSIGHVAGQANALNGIGWLYVQLGDYPAAIAHCERALKLLAEAGGNPYEAAAWDTLGYAHDRFDQPSQAAACYERAVHLLREMGDRYREADVLSRLGDARNSSGECEAARSVWQQAVTILEELGHPDADKVRAKIERWASARPNGPNGSVAHDAVQA